MTSKQHGAERAAERIDLHFAQRDAADASDVMGALGAHWAQPLSGAARLRLTESGLRLELEHATDERYSNAQIDDYTGRRAHDYPWRPPLRLRVRARASHAVHPTRHGRDQSATDQWLRGTVGFGFWNAPLTMAGGGLRLPDAVWFFGASPPSNMALTADGPGYGWKAQVVRSHRLGALTAVPPMALTALWARISGDASPAAGWLERLTGAREAVLDPVAADLRQWRDYTLEWLPDRARFWVDGHLALVADDPPRGPLGFVAWIDNQYAVATPRGELRFGLLDCEPQWLELDSITIEPLI